MTCILLPFLYFSSWNYLQLVFLSLFIKYLLVTFYLNVATLICIVVMNLSSLFSCLY